MTDPEAGEASATQRRLRIEHLRQWPRWLLGLGHTRRNLGAGLLLALGSPQKPREFRSGALQILILPLLSLAILALIDFVQTEPPRRFLEWALLRYGTACLVFFGGVFCLAHWLRIAKRTLWLAVALLAAFVWVTLAIELLRWVLGAAAPGGSSTPEYLPDGAFFLWALFCVNQALKSVYGPPRRHLMAPVVLYLAAALGASIALPSTTPRPWMRRPLRTPRTSPTRFRK